MLNHVPYLLLVLVLTFAALPARADESVVVRPEPAAGPLDNPLKGWAPYTNAGPIHQPYSMVFLYTSWRELEPREGEYAFDDWEQREWDVEAARGKHVIFRIYLDYPRRPSGVPEWVRERGVAMRAYDDYGGGQSPDYDDPRLLEPLERFIAALGERYNDDPRVAFVQVGTLGFWGEWHTYPRDELFASPDTVRRVIDAYRKAFPDKSLMARYPAGYVGEQAWIGFHDDMFPDDTDNGEDWGFLTKMRAAGRADNWARAVVGGEMVPRAAPKWLDDEHFGQTMTMLERAHFTWVGPYCPALDEPPGDEFVERSERMVRRMGYEYRLTEVRHAASARAGEKLALSVKGENDGVAPFYSPWPVELALLDDAGGVIATAPVPADIRAWLPGPFEWSGDVAFDAPPGAYRLALGIRDPWTDRPAVRFANDLPVHEGWTVVSRVRID